MHQDDLLVSFAFIAAMTFISGWIADRILGYSGFGVVGNWLLLLVGSYVGLYAYNLYGYQFNYNPALTIAVAASGGCSMLLTLASIKAATHT
jgi:uncharacterized membrane protein YeaQ/YmgE (transglycosylase-associated protein family)